jgi:hypothetical protein
MFYLKEGHRQMKVADKPLRCYQVLMVPNPYHCPHPLLIDQAIEQKAFFSYDRDFKFISGKQYFEEMWAKEDFKARLNNQRLYGFRSYASLASVLNNRNSDTYDEVIVEFEILIGTSYYYNPDTDMYFSQSIRCNGHCPLWKAMVGVLLQPIRSISAVI